MVKRIKKGLPGDGICQIQEQKSYPSFLLTCFLLNFLQFFCIKYQLFNLYILKISKKLKKWDKKKKIFKFHNTNDLLLQFARSLS